MNSLVTVQITGKNVKRFIQMLYKRGIRFYYLKFYSRYVEVTISYEDYLRLKEFRTIYEIHVISYKGLIRFQKILSTYKIFLGSFLIGLLLLVFLSHVIFQVEVIHDKKEVRDFIKDELKKNGIQKFSFVKTFDKGEDIVHDILRNHREKLEWLEIERIGTKYVVRVEERKMLDIHDENTPRDLIAKKKGVILSISATQGEVVKKVHDYVEAGDILVTGVIRNKDTIKGYVHAKGEVFAETWYNIRVEVPFAYKEIQKTGKNRNVLSLRFLNSDKRFLKTFETKQDSILFSLSNPLLPISISYIREEETKEEDSLYSYDLALLKAREVAVSNLQKRLGVKDEILYEKSLKNYEEDSKIVVEMFFKVKEDITSYVGILEEDPLVDTEERGDE